LTYGYGVYDQTFLEQAGGGAEVAALEYERSRIDRLEENLQRSGYTAKVLVADAGQPDGWWDGVLYDRILLDAPCSATGVIRRHPDIKRHRQPDDIPALVKQQASGWIEIQRIGLGRLI